MKKDWPRMAQMGSWQQGNFDVIAILINTRTAFSREAGASMPAGGRRGKETKSQDIGRLNECLFSTDIGIRAIRGWF